MTKEVLCISCPMGCRMRVEMDGGKVLSVTGNTCRRGETYAISEVTKPVRMVTSFVRTDEGVCVPVKTREPIPKEMIFDCVRQIKAAHVSLPVRRGDVILPSVQDTGIPVVATKTLE